MVKINSTTSLYWHARPIPIYMFHYEFMDWRLGESLSILRSFFCVVSYRQEATPDACWRDEKMYGSVCFMFSFFSSSGSNFAWGRFYFINMRTPSKHFSECTQFLAYNWMHIWCPLVVYSIVPICKLNFSTKQLSSVCIVAFINKQKTNKIPFQNNACASLICLFIRSAWKAGYVAWNFILVLYILYSVTF